MKKLFGERVKALRRMAGLTQARLASMTGLSDRFLGRVERGLAAPSFESVESLARALKVAPALLFRDEEPRQAAAPEPAARTAEPSRPPSPGHGALAPSFGSFTDQAAPGQDSVAHEVMAVVGILKDFAGMTVKCVSPDLRLIWMFSGDPARRDMLATQPLQTCHSRVHGLSAPCSGCLLPAAIEARRPLGGEVTTRDGLTFITRSTPVLDPEGNVTCAVHMALDITERKHMEEALRRTQARLEHLLASSPMVLRTCPPDDPFTPAYVSDNIRVIFGYTQLDLLSSSSFWLSLVHPSDIGRVRQAQNRLPVGNRLVQDYRIRNRDGVWRWVRDDQRLVTDREGRRLEIIGAWQDITDTKASEIVLRSSESRYRDLFLTNSTVQLLVDGETGAILDANPAAQAFYGYSSKALRSMNIADINTLEPSAVALRLKEASTARTRMFRFRHRLASGAIRDVEARVSPLLQGKRVVLHTLIFDVTESRSSMQAAQPSPDCEALLDMTSDMAAVLDPGGTLLACNEALAWALGDTPEALRGKTCPPELQDVLQDCGQPSAQGGAPQDSRLACRFAGKDVLATVRTVAGAGQLDRIMVVLHPVRGK